MSRDFYKEMTLSFYRINAILAPFVCIRPHIQAMLNFQVANIAIFTLHHETLTWSYLYVNFVIFHFHFGLPYTRRSFLLCNVYHRFRSFITELYIFVQDEHCHHICAWPLLLLLCWLPHYMCWYASCFTHIWACFPIASHATGVFIAAFRTLPSSNANYC